MQDLMTLQQASAWATQRLGKNVTTSNIAYLIQYGRIPRNGKEGSVFVNRSDLEAYYNDHIETKESRWKRKLGDDLNWNLSFSEYKESETTKHVHRLHPYKGKFIPQMVEYFLDNRTDQFKKESFFQEGDIILDPFCGSGTTLVQANELKMHAIGIDVSSFNAFISNTKIDSYNISVIEEVTRSITQGLKLFQKERKNAQFEENLLFELHKFNGHFFPSPKFKRQVRENEINEKQYGKEKSDEFLTVYRKLINEYQIPLRQCQQKSFLDKWFLEIVREEIDFVFKQVETIKPQKVRKIAALILSRTIRSCRATTHADLGTLKDPVIETYYCKKHGKICKPLFSILGWWQRYAQDTIKRLLQFEKLKTNTCQKCLVGDSRTINITQTLNERGNPLARLVKTQKISGIFSSPPYVGLIDYHDQHAYAYDLFGFERRDELEIGPLYKGQGVAARQSYIEGISAVLNNCKSYLKPDYDIFLVANDKYGMYAQIAERSNMRIFNQYKRPVLNRVEKDRSAYAETIFHMKEK